MTPRTARLLAAAALLWLCAAVSLALQNWIGDLTVYGKDIEAQRAALHQAILDNRPPGGKTWAEWGALSVQKRVGVVYLAEAVRKVSGLRIGAVYKLLDTAFLMLSLLALFAYLRRWVPQTMALVGLLYFSAVLPLTYLFQLFHPWDRPQLLLWILLLGLIADRRLGLLALGLGISVFVKFDTVLLPALYFAVHVQRQGRGRLLAETALLATVVVGASVILGQLFGDAAEASRFSLAGVAAQLAANWSKLQQMKLGYPPLLVHGLPMALALFGWRGQPRFVGVALLSGVFMSLIHVALTNYEEVRAHMMVLVLTMPAALVAARRLLERNVAGAADGR
ncbi:MAG: hypothetical protein GXC94_03395 [Comamonadaceae bacterium]|nr:hypothetical protein [Comamonadaceae bacterium]